SARPSLTSFFPRPAERQESLGVASNSTNRRNPLRFLVFQPLTKKAVTLRVGVPPIHARRFRWLRWWPRSLHWAVPSDSAASAPGSRGRNSSGTAGSAALWLDPRAQASYRLAQS